MFGLEPPEIELLLGLVEAHRSRAGKDQTMVLLESRGIRLNDDGPDCSIVFAGGGETRLRCYAFTFDGLEHAGFVRATVHSSSTLRRFVVTKNGQAAADAYRAKQGQEHRVEAEVRSLLNPEGFAERYPLASKTWAEAVRMLDDPPSDLKAGDIGNRCRDAVTAFAVPWCKAAGGECADPPDKQIRHVEAGLKALAAGGDKEATNYLLALFQTWRLLIPLVMRQSHNREKVGSKLSEEDGRLVAFQTGLVMFELDRIQQRRLRPTAD